MCLLLSRHLYEYYRGMDGDGDGFCTRAHQQSYKLIYWKPYVMNWMSWYAVERMCLHRSEMILFLSCRAQDQASMQLSEMEEEMDQRIHAAERKTREQVG